MCEFVLVINHVSGFLGLSGESLLGRGLVSFVCSLLKPRHPPHTAALSHHPLLDFFVDNFQGGQGGEGGQGGRGSQGDHGGLGGHGGFGCYGWLATTARGLVIIYNAIALIFGTGQKLMVLKN